ncbi:MAG TPA: protein kinase [Thermoanaerobaculia bacterium]|nr:protein kinase [Thermoanaerobaculia bacterium]
MNLQNGTRLGPYEIVAPIGAGGMGEVYRARDTRLGRTVAVKILPPAFASDAKLKIRFEREAKAISALNHPHICTLHDVGDSYFVMEYCEGQSLASRIAAGPMPFDEVFRYGIEIADALDAAHRQGIVHRDLKPSNIMITSSGVKLLDFGLARQSLDASSDITTIADVTEEGKILGTIQYMAPEVLRGKAADERSDIFALGLTLYEMVSGKRAFDGTSKAEVIAAILEREPASLIDIEPKTPPALDLLIRACLAKDPEERIQTANDVRLQLRAISEGAPRSARARLYALGSARPKRGRGPATWAAAALIALTGAGWFVWQQSRAAATAPIRSLVVLPFENLSAPDDEYLAAGMHDGVIGQLSQISGLRLISRTSALHYKDAKKTIPDIARELDVDGIVEGSVTRTENNVRIRVELMRARPEERQVWSKTYERGIGGATAVQTDIVRAIALATHVALTADETTRLSRSRSFDPKTYEAYLKGMFHVRKLTQDGAQKGLQYLKDAVAADPSNAATHAGLALAYSIISHGPSPGPDVVESVKSEAAKAIALDDTVAEAHAALGGIAMFHDWNWPVAERELKRALELDPNFAQAHRDYGWFLELRGPNHGSIAEMQKAKQLDPLTALYTSDLAWLYYRAGRLDDAVREARAGVELDPDGTQGKFALVVACGERSLHKEAIATGQRAAAISPVWKFALAYAYAKANRKDEAVKIAAEAAKNLKPVSTWGLAYTYAALGDREEALRWLERGLQSRFSFLLWMKDTPAFAPLHGDPRFEELVREMKLPR